MVRIAELDFLQGNEQSSRNVPFSLELAAPVLPAAQEFKRGYNHWSIARAQDNQFCTVSKLFPYTRFSHTYHTVCMCAAYCILAVPLKLAIMLH